MNLTRNERVLIGSSNVFRFYRPESFADYPKYEMLKCTRSHTFKVQMKSLDKANKLVVISVIENFLVDAAKKGESIDPENFASKFDEIISSEIKDFADTVKEAATRLPETKFILVKPILRPAINWYDLNFDEFAVELKERVAEIGLNNITEIESLSRASQTFIEDDIHLTEESGRLFVDCMILSAEEQYNVGPVIDITEEDEGRMETETPQEETTTTQERRSTFRIAIPQENQRLETRVEGVERGLKKLESEFKANAWRNCLMTAKLREDQDFMTNVKNEDRVILTGLTAKTPPPINKSERDIWIRDIAKELLETMDKEAAEKIVFVKQGRSNDKNIPMAEVRFDTKEIATRVRKMFVEKRKGGHDFGRLYMANSVTLATRVRIDIMKGIVKQFSGKDDMEMYVSAYTSRPILRIKNIKTQWSGILTFADAIGRYGKKLSPNNLEDAYRRAGRAFNDLMEHTFVVLSDKRRNTPPAPIDQTKKRPREDPQLVYNRNKEPRVERGGWAGRRGSRGVRGERGGSSFRGRGQAGGSNLSNQEI